MDIFNILIDFIVEEALVMIPVLLILGWVIKQTEKITNNWIPAILLVAGVGFTPLLLGGYAAENIVQGALVTGGAVLIHQLYKQGKEIKKENK